MLSHLARLLFRRRRRVLIGAVLLVFVAGAVGGPVAGLLESDDDFDPPSAEAVQAREAIADATGASATPDVIALVRGGDPAAVARAAAGPEVADVASPVESTDGRSSYLAITLRNGADADAVVDRLEVIIFLYNFTKLYVITFMLWYNILNNIVRGVYNET